MTVLILTVGVFNWMVTFFLLIATGLLSHDHISYPRLLFCGMLSGIHSAVCLLPQFRLLSFWWCRLIVLSVVPILSFGIRDLRKVALFFVLDLAVVSFAAGVESPHPWLYAIFTLVWVLALLLLTSKTPQFRDLELKYRGKNLRLRAMEDTGNLLKDPMTGKSVLVIDPVCAESLTGLSRKQLGQPLKTLEDNLLQGLRLIPYHTINAPTGFLLAVKMEYRKGKKYHPILVAFAPEMLDREGKIQGLIGGRV